MGSIPRNRWIAAGVILLAALLIGYFFDRPNRTTAGPIEAEASATPAPAADTRTAERTPVPFEVQTVDQKQTEASNQAVQDQRSEDLPNEAQRTAAECLKGLLPNPTEDTKTLSSLSTAFFNETQTTSQAANQEITFIDTDGAQKKIKVDTTGINEAGQTVMRARMFRVSSGDETEEAIPYELQSLEWQELLTRYLDGKRRLREKVVLAIQSPTSDRSAIVEMIDGKRTEVTFEFGTATLSCGYDVFTKANRCDCQDTDGF